jgi:hypothetical protein
MNDDAYQVAIKSTYHHTHIRINGTMIVCGFPGVGKTFLSEKYERFEDSDSSSYSKHEDFPLNYVDHLVDIRSNKDCLLISTHKLVREQLVKRGLAFYLVYPEGSLKKEYMKRYEDRGSPQKFLDHMENNWDKYLKQLEGQTDCYHFVLNKEGMFLSDILCYNVHCSSGY